MRIPQTSLYQGIPRGASTDLIVASTSEHGDVIDVRARQSIYRDRLAIEVIDVTRQAWGVHVLLTPCQPLAAGDARWSAN